VLLDLRDECEKYGVVTDVLVPRPDQPQLAAALMGTGNYGKVRGGGGGADEDMHATAVLPVTLWPCVSGQCVPPPCASTLLLPPFPFPLHYLVPTATL
jgi:hypothetical protein